MTKLCPRGKAAAKRKFKVYPSAYANAYASKICAGKIKDPSGVKRKDFRGPKPSGAKVGMAVTAGSQSGMGRLEKSGLTKAKKGKMMIMIAVGKPVKKSKGGDAKIKKVIKGLHKASALHKGQAKSLQTVVKKANKGAIMKVANKLEKASKAHAGQAKTLKSLKLSRGGGMAVQGMNFKGVY